MSSICQFGDRLDGLHRYLHANALGFQKLTYFHLHVPKKPIRQLFYLQSLKMKIRGKLKASGGLCFRHGKSLRPSKSYLLTAIAYRQGCNLRATRSSRISFRNQRLFASLRN